MEEHPGKSFRELRSLPAYSYTFTFLRREDKEWTEEHFPIGSKKPGRKAVNWKAFDKMYLPKIKELIEKEKLKETRPIRITKSYIYKELGISQYGLNHMRCCNEMIIKNTETYPQYWAREVKWAIKFLREQNMILRRTKQ